MVASLCRRLALSILALDAHSTYLLPNRICSCTRAPLSMAPSLENPALDMPGMAPSASSATDIQTGQMQRAFVTTYCARDSRDGTPRCTHFLPWTLPELLQRSSQGTYTAQSIPRQAPLQLLQKSVHIMDCNYEPQRCHPFSTAREARLQSHRSECDTGNREGPRRGRLVPMPRAAREDARTPREAKWARDS